MEQNQKNWYILLEPGKKQHKIAFKFKLQEIQAHCDYVNI